MEVTLPTPNSLVSSFISLKMSIKDNKEKLNLSFLSPNEKQSYRQKLKSNDLNEKKGFLLVVTMHELQANGRRARVWEYEFKGF